MMGKTQPKQHVKEVNSKMLQSNRWHWGWGVVLASGVAVALVALVATRSVHAVSSPDLDRLVQRPVGPWGELEYTRIAIEPPEEYLDAQSAGQYQPERWVFEGHNRDQVKALFDNADLTAAEKECLLNKAKWEETPEAVTVCPDKDTVLGLSSKSREIIYSVLACYRPNLHQTQPFAFRPELLGERFEKSGLNEQTIAGFKRLLYPEGHALFFADATVYMSTIQDNAERMRFYRTVSRRVTLLAKLKVTPESNIDQLEKYWDYDGRHKDLRALFESLARVPGGCRIDIVHLLSPFARKRIYTFPPPSDDPLAARRDCHWSALNFFNDPPDDRFCDPQTVKQTLENDYDKVEGEHKLGDVIVLFHPGGETVHSAVYLADDLVFTKNGGAKTQPWVYMRLNDMLEYYNACSPPNDPLQMVFLRRKSSK